MVTRMEQQVVQHKWELMHTSGGVDKNFHIAECITIDTNKPVPAP